MVRRMAVVAPLASALLMGAAVTTRSAVWAGPCTQASPSPSPSSAPAPLHARLSVRRHQIGADVVLDYRIELHGTGAMPSITVTARLSCAPAARFVGRPKTTTGQATLIPGAMVWKLGLTASVRSAVADYSVRVPAGTAQVVVNELSVDGPASNCPADPQCGTTLTIRPRVRPAGGHPHLPAATPSPSSPTSPPPPPSPVSMVPGLPQPSLPVPSSPSLTLSQVDRPPLVPAVNSPAPSSPAAAPAATVRPAAYSRGSVSTSTLALVAGVLILTLGVMALAGRLAGLDVVRRRSGRS